MTLIIAGERSGAGKTTVTLAILAALKHRHLSVISFKVGPDYIDPMFHQGITGHPCRNLDPILTSESYVQHCFHQQTQSFDFAIIEGVMGLFDGVRLRTDFARSLTESSLMETPPLISDFASTAHIARLLELPVVLVIDCSRLSGSVAAIASGYRSLDPRVKMAGVILNKVGSDRHLELLKAALEPLNLPIFGVLHRQDAITIPDRHLGLVPTGELSEFNAIVEQLVAVGERCFDWQLLLPALSITQTAISSPSRMPEIRPLIWPDGQPLRIAIAQDRAFNFYYRDNLEILQQFGAELVFWSPLEDCQLPEQIDGFYFGGGFPEVFAAQLSENCLVKNSLKVAIMAGTPVYAECGGLMYLAEKIIDFTGTPWTMVGVLPTTALMGKHLKLGYRQAVVQQESPLVTPGMKVRGHEFHRSDLTTQPSVPLYHCWRSDQLLTDSPLLEGWKVHQVHSSYLHLHWGCQLEIPQRFLQVCHTKKSRGAGEIKSSYRSLFPFLTSR